jgi:hypothetical protein
MVPLCFRGGVRAGRAIDQLMSVAGVQSTPVNPTLIPGFIRSLVPRIYECFRPASRSALFLTALSTNRATLDP